MIYLHAGEPDLIFLMDIYCKAEREDLTKAEVKKRPAAVRKTSGS